jgi:hypothetical protein
MPMQYEIRFNVRARIVRHQIVPKKELGIIPEIAEVITLGNEIENPGPKFIFPFQAQEALVKGNGAGSKRKRAVKVAHEVMRANARNRLRLPGKEVIPSQSEGVLAEVGRGQLIHGRNVHALDQTLTRVVDKGLDLGDVAEYIAGYRGIERVCREKQLREVFSLNDQILAEDLIPIGRHGEAGPHF